MRNFTICTWDVIIIKKLRVVAVHHPKLCKIRNSLREIILHAYHDYDAYLQSIWLATTNSRESDRYRAHIEGLQESLNRSICKCMICQSIINDMVYIPRHKAWFCINCWKNNLIPFR